MINLQQTLICGAKHSYKQIEIILVDPRVYRACWSGRLLPLVCATRSRGRSAVASSATPPVLAILESETTTPPEQRFFQVRELLNTFPNVF